MRKKVKDFYNNIANDYNFYFKDSEFINEDKEIKGLIEKHLVGNILEIGSGTGLFLEWFEDINKDRYVGVDISEKMIEISREKHKEYIFLNDDILGIPSGYRVDSVIGLYGIISYLDKKELNFLLDILEGVSFYFLMSYRNGYFPKTYEKSRLKERLVNIRERDILRNFKDSFSYNFHDKYTIITNKEYEVLRKG